MATDIETERKDNLVDRMFELQEKRVRRFLAKMGRKSEEDRSRRRAETLEAIDTRGLPQNAIGDRKPNLSELDGDGEE